jgi:opacity protein-like surface antigen
MGNTHMKTSQFGLAVAMLGAAATLSAPALADGYVRGSIKDAPVARPGHCYIRGDIGYSWSRDPNAKWTVTDADPLSPTFGTFLTDSVTNTSLENVWLFEGGFGCGSGSRGLRGEIMLGYHGKRDFEGTPGPWLPPPGVVDPMHTSIKTTTLMFNAYYDLGNMRGFVPYLGAGVGFARNEMDGVYFTNNAALINTIEGKDTWALAWSLMAGVGYQISDRLVLDFGYRYLDMGHARSGTIDSAGFTNPPVRIDDISAHEFKIGLRYHFGTSAACCEAIK